MSTVKEYSGIPFGLAIGEIYGMRLWKVDQYGRLRARNWSGAGPWRPGVNEAKCLAERGGSFDTVIDPTGKGRHALSGTVRTEPDYYSGGGLISGASNPYSISVSTRTRYTVEWDDGKVETYDKLDFGARTAHEAPAESCACGFYAYTDPDHIELDGYNAGASYVLGIIKGTGRTLIGTKGFRCEKAEIVALLDPTGVSEYDPKALAHQKKLVARVYDVPLLPDREALLAFAPIEQMLPDPSTDEFWALP